jgi:hypothetical protein
MENVSKNGVLAASALQGQGFLLPDTAGWF